MIRSSVEFDTAIRVAVAISNKMSGHAAIIALEGPECL